MRCPERVFSRVPLEVAVAIRELAAADDRKEADIVRRLLIEALAARSRLASGSRS